MPNIKSQIKRDKQNKLRKVRNADIKSKLKTLTKNYLTSVEEKDKDKAAEVLKNFSQTIDKAVSKGIIHKNQAARRKARLAQKLKQLA